MVLYEIRYNKKKIEGDEYLWPWTVHITYYTIWLWADLTWDRFDLGADLTWGPI